jgi:excisionase family DNA binding protein
LRRFPGIQLEGKLARRSSGSRFRTVALSGCVRVAPSVADPTDHVAIMQTVPTESTKLLSVKEVALRLRISEWSVYQKIHHEGLPAVRLGRGNRQPIRIDERELDRWLYEIETEDDLAESEAERPLPAAP